jgi:hypothetical protein
MIREDKFVLSKRQYAVNLNTWTSGASKLNWREGLGLPAYWHRGRAEAVWFRRKAGITSASYGLLSVSMDSETDEPIEPATMLRTDTDGRYGGHAWARWDGNEMWAPETGWDQVVRWQAFLSDVLDSYGEIPTGFDGWWRFETTAEADAARAAKL